MLTHIVWVELEGGASELLCPFAEADDEAGIDDPADVEQRLVSPNVHGDDRVPNNHGTAALPRKSADSVTNILLNSINDCNPSFVGQAVLIKLDSLSIFVMRIVCSEIVLERTAEFRRASRVGTWKAKYL